MTRADSVARFTLAPLTPGCFFSTFSTRETQEAQVMPPMPRSIWLVSEGFENSEMVVVFIGSVSVHAVEPAPPGHKRGPPGGKPQSGAGGKSRL
ncbi:hypothetical protein Y695_04543 [Hydrogenophaga sp. T4]|nr:hypothetical protein Y695_04543 [Hydrogenophaga sp. T4]